MTQSKLESHIETAANMGSGMVVSWLVWMYIVAPLVNAGYVEVGPAGSAATVTCIFTVTSYIRSYVWRRFFNARLHRLLSQSEE
jgi:membrane protein implicated in regulation of membrane protease activity